MTALVHAPVNPRLFSPITLAATRIELPHRLVMSSMYMGWEDELKKESVDYWNAMTAFYASRVRGGAHLVVAGGMSPSLVGRWYPSALSLTTKDTARSLRRVTDGVHKEGGRILAQPFHGGLAACSPWRLTASTSRQTERTPYKWTRALGVPTRAMRYLVSEYERFFRLAVEAGFDGVEIPVTEGSLLHNFVCKARNARTDKYGGDIDNRTRVVLEVLDSIRYAVPTSTPFIVSCRICVHDLIPDGNTMQDTLRMAELIGRSGLVDMINTSVGNKDSCVNSLASYVPRATFARSVKQVRDHLRALNCTVPIAYSHRVMDTKVGEELIEKEVCDLVSVGRPFLADAEFANNSRMDQPHLSVPCIACMHCTDRLMKAQRVKCAVNPLSGYESERQLSPARFPKTIAVVGAGAAGITCALTLSRRGHRVLLYERSQEIGGQLNLAKMVPGKEEYYNLLEYWTQQLRESNVIVKMGSEFVRDDVAASHQMIHRVVLCSGSIPRAMSPHNIIGAEHRQVVSFEDVLYRRVVCGRKVAIVGNGAIGWDVASFLLHDHRVCKDPKRYAREWGVDLYGGTTDFPPTGFLKNNREVMLFQKAANEHGLSKTRGWSTRLWLQHHGMDTMFTGLYGKLDKEGVHFSTPLPNEQGYLYPADTVVWALGMLPNASVGVWLHEWVKDGAIRRGQTFDDFSVYSAGSCRDATTGQGAGEQDLLRAIHEGYEIGSKIE